MNHERIRWQRWIDVLASVGFSAVDAIGIVLYLLAVDVLLVRTVTGQTIIAALTLPLVVFVPGYALVSVLFPGAYRPDTRPERPFSGAAAGALTWLERLTLSFGVSITILPLFGLGHSISGFQFDKMTLLVVLNVFIVGCLAISVWRRLKLPVGEQLVGPLYASVSRMRARAANKSGIQLGVTVLALALAVLATSTLVGAVVTPTDGEQYTTLKLLTEDESGDLVADDYPREFEVGESRPVVVGIENHEQQRMTYTLVTQLQSTQLADGERIVEDTVELSRTSRTLSAGSSWETTQLIRPDRQDVDRVAILLYRGDPPANPSAESADRVVHFWITVTDDSG
jgi:uncharacterized membrane protein